MSKKKPFFPPFRAGDVVKFIGKEDGFWQVGAQHIIKDVNVFGKNDYRYSTDHGTWFEHPDFELVRPCDEASIKELMKKESQQ